MNDRMTAYRKSARKNFPLGAIAIVACVNHSEVAARQETRSEIAIRAQPLETALNKLAQSYGIQIIVLTSDTRGKSARAIRGNYTLGQALRRILRRSGLEYKYVNKRTIVVRKRSSIRARSKPSRRSKPSNQVARVAPQNAAEQAQESVEIVVTGTRIANPNLSSANPITTITVEDIQKSGRTQLVDILERTPALKQSEQFDQFSDGRQFLNLRHLGSQRTLTLVDGKRFVPSSSRVSSVDISNIPGALLERVDILTGGTSAIYGADAVTGVVNFILKDDYEGVSVTGQYGAAAKDWDAEEGAINLLVGMNFGGDRGNITASYSYRDLQPLLTADRDFSRAGARQFLRFNDAETGPNLVFEVDPPSGQSRNGAEILPNGFFSTNSINGDGTPFTEADQSTNAEVFFQQLRAGRQTHNFSLSGRYEFSDALETYLRVIYSDSNNESRTSFGQFTFFQPLSIDNPFLSQEALDVIGPGPFPSFSEPRFNRLDNDRPVITSTDIETFQFHGGIRGDISDHLRYDLSVGIGRNEIDESSNRIVRERYLAAIDAVSVNGEIVCRDTSVFADCVPLNIFSKDESVNGAAYDFIYRPSAFTNDIDQDVVTAFLSGDLAPLGLTLPGGGIEFVVGAEYRKETFETTVNEFTTVDPVAPQSISVAELFGELALPIFKDAGPLLDQLTLRGAVRYSDYNTSGGSWTYNGGVVWGLSPDLQLRGTFARAVRSPTVTDLFEETFNFEAVLIDDPCDDDSLDQGTEFRAANCATVLTAAGANPATYDFNAIAIQGSFLLLPATRGGNPELEPETSDTFTLGFVFTPSFLENLAITVDYYDIKIKGAIGPISEAFILEQCVDLPTTDNQFCDLVTRGTNGAPNLIATQPVNIGRFETSGFEASVSYGVPGTSIGDFRATLAANYLEVLDIQTNSDPASAVDERGLLGGDDSFFPGVSPTWSVNFDLDWTLDAWDSRFGINYHNSVLRTLNVNRENAAEFVPEPFLDELWNLRYELGYRINDSLRINAGVNNILNQKPDIGSNFQPISPVGRFVYFGVQYNLNPF